MLSSPLAVNSGLRAAASRWFQASKNPLMAVLISARGQALAAGAALLAPAAGLPGGECWPELPVQPAEDRIRAGTATSPAAAARPCRRLAMPALCAQRREP